MLYQTHANNIFFRDYLIMVLASHLTDSHRHQDQLPATPTKLVTHVSNFAEEEAGITDKV